MNIIGLLLLFIGAAQAGSTNSFGNYYTLFSASSLWNSRPVNPVFSANVSVPTSSYFPAISAGAYSTGVFLGVATDAAATVYPRPGQQGVWNVDAFEWLPSLTIPHWPADSVPATGSDGHCDIVDQTTGVLHSFWQLSKNDSGSWIAQQYAWSRVDGNGFGDPAHYFQGARAAGVPTSAGIIRSHEVNDGNPIYNHAFAMSLTFNGLDKNPTYIYPATSADSDAASANSGDIPEGALLMLPPDYNTTITGFASVALKKVADTLKVYGAYVVDRNYGTPYVIYVENGAPFSMSNKSWDNAVAAELQRIRGSLRMVPQPTKCWMVMEIHSCRQQTSTY